MAAGRTFEGLALGACLGAALVGSASCRFDPSLASGSLGCAGDRSCPAPFVCRTTGKCCAVDDQSVICSGPAPGSIDAPLLPTDGARDRTSADGDGGMSAATPNTTPSADAGHAEDGGMPAMNVTRLLDGAFKLIDWQNGCTSARNAASVERWCGFYRGTELWVLDVSHAATTGQVRCDGTDAGCLRLTSTAFRSDVARVFWRPGFEGDLLIYQADPRQAAGQDFQGNVYAWRPGWTAGRQLSSPNGTFCRANELDGSSVACYEQIDSGHADLRGGRLPVDETTPLPKIASGAPQASEIQITYSGDYLVYSAAATAAEPPSLYALPAGQVNDPGTQVLIANDARLLAVGANGTRAFFLRGANFTLLDPVGALVRVDLPSGKNPVEMARGIEGAAVLNGLDAAERVYAYEMVDDKLEANFRLFPDATAPTTSVLVGRSEIDAFAVSLDARFVYTQSSDPKTGQSVARVFDMTTRTSCDLGPVPAFIDGKGVPTGPSLNRFSVDGTRVYWQKAAAPPSQPETWIASAADCKPIGALGPGADLPWDLGAGGLVFQEGWSAADGGMLRFLRAGASSTDSSSVRIFDATDRNFAVIGGDATSTVVFTSGAPNREGIYLAKVPL